MIPKKLFQYDGKVNDPDVSRALYLIDLQFQELLRSSTIVALGAIANSKKLQNVDAYWIVHTFGGAANTDEIISHPLARVPRGIINIETPAFPTGTPVVGVVTFGSVPPTVTQATVRCNAASKIATFILFA